MNTSTRHIRFSESAGTTQPEAPEQAQGAASPPAAGPKEDRRSSTIPAGTVRSRALHAAFKQQSSQPGQELRTAVQSALRAALTEGSGPRSAESEARISSLLQTLEKSTGNAKGNAIAQAFEAQRLLKEAGIDAGRVNALADATDKFLTASTATAELQAKAENILLSSLELLVAHPAREAIVRDCFRRMQQLADPEKTLRQAIEARATLAGMGLPTGLLLRLDQAIDACLSGPAEVTIVENRNAH